MNARKLVSYLFVLSVVAIGVLGAGGQALSAVVTWDGSAAPDLTWTNPINWSTDVAPVANDSIVFDSAGSAAAAGAVTNLVSTTTPNYIKLTYQALLGTGGGGYQTTEIGTGVVLNLKGSDTTSQDILYVGNGATGITKDSQVYTSITGAGTLRINDAYDVLQVKQGFVSDGTRMATLDMSGLANFDCALVGKIRIGFATGGSTSNDNRATGTLKLAKNNFIKVDDAGDEDFVIGSNNDNGGSNALPTLLLGETNTIYTDKILIGSKKTGGYIGFNTTAGFVNPKVTFRDDSGATGRMTRFSVGDDYKQGNTGVSSSAAADFTAGEIDALVNELIIGRSYNASSGTGTGTKTGVMSFDLGVVDVTTLRIGTQGTGGTNSAGNGIGTLSIGGDSASSFGKLIVGTTLSMANRGTGWTQIPQGTLNLTGYALAEVKSDIANGGGTSTLRIADNATLDMQPTGDTTAGNITVSVLKADGGTIKNAASITVTNRIMISGATSTTLTNVGTVTTGGIGGVGTFTTAGALALVAGGGGVVPGDIGTIGTLSVPNGIVIPAAVPLSFDIATPTTIGGGVNDLFEVGALTLDNNTVNIKFDYANRPTSPGVYRLVNYTGTKTGSLNPVGVNETRYAFAIDEATLGQINLNVSGGPGTIKWTGATSGDWDINNTANWDLGGSATQFKTLDNVVFDDTAGVPLFINVGNGVAVRPDSITINADANNFVISGTGTGKITGTTGVVKNGTSTLTLGMANDFTGTVYINNGILKANNGSAFGATSAPTIVAAGATLDVNNQTIVEEIRVSGAGYLGQGAIINTGANQNNALRNVVLLGDVTFGGPFRWDVRLQAGTGVFAGNNHNITKIGPEVMAFVGLGEINVGNISLDQGTIGIETTTTMNTAGTITAAAGTALRIWNLQNPMTKPLVMNGATLNVASAADGLYTPTYAGPITLNLDSTFTAVDGAPAIDLLVSGAIGGAGGALKTGAGFVSFSNDANTYAGKTLVAAGTLALQPSAAVANNIASSTSIEIAGGATFDVTGVTAPTGFVLAAGQALGGSGGGINLAYVRGNVTTSAGAKLLPGGSGLPGTLNLDSKLTLAGGDTLEFDLVTDTTYGNGINDYMIVNGDLTRNGVTTIKINPLSLLTNGTPYTLMHYWGALAGTGSFNVTSDSRYNFTLSEATPNTITVSAVGGAAASLTWTGSVDGKWDINATANWDNLGVGDKFFQGDNVTFSGTPAQTTIDLVGTLLPGSITVNSSADFLFQGSGRISGTGGIVKQGTGKLIIANAGINDNTGLIDIQGGILQVGNGGVEGNLGNGAITINIAATGGLVIDKSADMTMANIINGPGGLEKKGAGVLTLSGANSYAGVTTITAGTVRVTDPLSLGVSTGKTAIAAGATLNLNGVALGGEPVEAQGAGVGGLGAIINTGAAQPNNALQNVTLTGDTTFGGTARWDIDNGPFNAAGFKLTKVGNIEIAIENVGETYLGDIEIAATAVSNNMLTFTGTATLGDPNKTATVSGLGNILHFYNTGAANVLNKKIVLNDGYLRNGTGDNILDGTITISGAGTIQVPGGSLRVLSKISGDALRKLDANVLILANSGNDFSGGATINGGTIQVGDGAGVDGSIGTGPVSNSGTLTFLNTGSYTFNGGINGTGVVNQGTAIGQTLGTTILGGGGTFTGKTNVYSGVLRLAHDTALGDPAGITQLYGNVNAAGRLELSNNITVADPITLDGRQAPTADAVALGNFSGNNTLTGDITGNTGGGNWNLGSDAGKLTLAGNIGHVAGATGNRYLQFFGAGDGEISGNINQVSGTTINLVSKGTGTWTFSGTNTHSGPVTINTGTFAFTSVASQGAVTTYNVTGGTLDVSAIAGGMNVDAGKTINGGTTTTIGTVLGTLNAQTGGAVLPGGRNAAGTLKIENLNLQGAALTVDLGNATTVGGGVNDLYDITGTLTRPDASVTDVILNPLPRYTSGTYRLMNVNAKAGTGTFNVVHNSRFAVTVDESVAGQINLNFVGTPVDLAWSGVKGGLWDTGKSANWKTVPGGVAEKFYWGDPAKIDDTGNGKFITLNETVLPGATALPMVFEVDNTTRDYVVGGSGKISGSLGFTKKGTGTFTLSTSNDFTGAVTVEGGTLVFGPATPVNTAFPTNTYSGGTTIKSGAMLKVFSENAIGSGPLTIEAGGTFDINAQEGGNGTSFGDRLVTVAGAGVDGKGAIINSGQSAYNSFRRMKLTGDVTFGGTGRWDVRLQSSVGTLDAGGFNITKVGPNQVGFTEIGSTNFGNIDIQQGNLRFEKTTRFADPSKTVTVAKGAVFSIYQPGTTASSAVTANLVLNGGTLENSNTSAHWGTPGSQITVNADSIINNSYNNDTGISTFTINSDIGGAGGVNFNTANTNGPGSGHIILLAGSNTYTGPTVITGKAGTILRLAAAATLFNTQSIEVRAGTTFDVSLLTGGYMLNNQTLSGAGTVLGGVWTDYSGGSTIIPGADGGLGTLTFSNGAVSVNSGTKVRLDISDTASDLVSVTGASGSIYFDSTAQLIVTPVAPLIGTSYLVANGTSLSGTPTLVNQSRYSLTLDTSTANQLKITRTPGPAPLGLVWTGGSGVWDVKTAANWQAVGPEMFYQADLVDFTDTAAIKDVSLTGMLAPQQVIVTTTGTYTFQGPGYLAGGAALAKNGSGTLVVKNTGVNIATGAIFVNEGKLQVGDGGTAGTLGSGAITNNATLEFNRSDDLTVANAISGSGTLEKKGAGVLTLSGASAYDGVTTVSAGTLKLGNAAALGSAVGKTVVVAGATLDIGGGNDVGAELIEIGGTGVGGLGALVNTGASNNNALTNVTLTADVLVNTDNEIGVANTGATFNGGGFKLTKTGDASFILNGVGETNLGDVEILQDRLVFQGTTTLGDPAKTITVRKDGVLTFNANTTTLDKKVVVQNGRMRQGGGSSTFKGLLTLDGGMALEDGGTGSTLNLTGKITGNGGILMTGTGNLYLSNDGTLGANDFTGGVTINSGYVRVTTAASLNDDIHIVTNVATGGGLVFQPDLGQTITYGGVIGGSGSVHHAQTAQGMTVLTGANLYTGITRINGGVLRITHPDALGPGSYTVIDGDFATPPSHSGRLELSGGITLNEAITLEGRSSTVADTPHISNFAGNNTLASAVTANIGSTTGFNWNVESQAGLLTVSGTLTNGLASGVGALQLQGAGNGQWDSVIANGATATTALRKQGAGTWTVTNVGNTFTGPVAVDGGTLAFTSQAAAGSPPAFTLGGGTLDVSAVSGGFVVGPTQTLAGQGAVSGATTVDGSLTVGVTGTPGTLTFNNALTLGPTAATAFDVSTAGFDKVTGVTNIAFGGSLTVQALGAGITGPGVFDLFDWTGAASGTFAGGITLPTLGAGLAWKDYGGGVLFDYASGQIEALSLGPVPRVWNGGAGDDFWTSGTNWVGGTAPAAGDTVVFSGNTRLTPDNNTSFAVGGVTFDSSAAGSFVLGGNPLTVAGKIDVQAGAATPQKIDVGVTLATDAVTPANTGVINVADAATTLEIAKPVSGAVGLKKTGDGILRLSSTTLPNTYTGNTVVEAGTLRVDGGINLNAATDDTIVGTASTTATLITDHVSQDALTINAGSTVQITGTTTSVVNFLQIANGSGGFTWDAGSGGAAPAGATDGSGATAVPEPATWLLALIAALAGCVAWRRRR